MSKKSARKKELQRQKRNRLVNKSYTSLENNSKLADQLYKSYLADYARNEKKYGNMNWNHISKNKFLASMDAMGKDLTEENKPHTLKQTYDALLDRATFGQTQKQYKLAWSNNPELRKKYKNDMTKFLGKGKEEYEKEKYDRLKKQFNALFEFDENIHFNYDYYDKLPGEEKKQYLRSVLRDAGLRYEDFVDDIKQLHSDVSSYFSSTWFQS